MHRTDQGINRKDLFIFKYKGKTSPYKNTDKAQYARKFPGSTAHMKPVSLYVKKQKYRSSN